MNSLPYLQNSRAFLLMLTGVALTYYFNNVKGSTSDFDMMVIKVRKRFLTEERTLVMTREWDSTLLVNYIKENPEKSKNEYLEKIIARLQELQECLPEEYRSDIMLKNKLLSAVAGVEECRLARQKVSSTVEGVIGGLHNSIESTLGEKPDKSNTFTTALLAERRRVRRNSMTHNKNKGKLCYVCKKANCWSIKHPVAERIKAFRENKKLRAFMTECYLTETEDDKEGFGRSEIEEIDLEDLMQALEENQDGGQISNDIPTSHSHRLKKNLFQTSQTV